ncbi:MAG: outer membrane protein [Myxococcaceae bacterium]|nr:outer membrane protein [Myxococcaceae bacterium]
MLLAIGSMPVQRPVLRRLVGVAVVLLGLEMGARDALADETAPAPRAITLSEALAYARSHQPQLRAALARVSAARAQAVVPRSHWLPSVGATAQIFGGTTNNTTASYLSTAYVDVPRIGGTRSVAAQGSTLAPYASTVVGVGLTQEVFEFGRIAAQSAAADALIEVGKHDADAVRLDIELGVEEAFFAVQAAKAVLQASEGALERARAHRDLAQAGVGSGLRSPIELTRAEADLQRFDIGRIRARGGVTVSQSVLAAAIGSSELSLDASAAGPTIADMPALANAIQQASARDPRLMQTLAQLKAQERQSRAVGAALRPDVFLTGTLSGRAGGAAPTNGDRADYSGLLPSVPNWDAGLILSWPLFDGTITARRDASRAQEQVRRDEIDAARQFVVANVQQAYVHVEVARATLPGLRRAVEAALANYAQADARFKAGLGTSVELADAEGLRARSEIDLAIGAFELVRARAMFGRAIAEGL